MKNALKNSGKKFSEIKNSPVTRDSKYSIGLLSFVMSSLLFIGGTATAFIKSRKSTKTYDKCVTYQDTLKLYTSINGNPNLDEEEKKILNGLDEFFDDYYSYIDYDTACMQLSKFDIKYYPSEDKYCFTAGDWNAYSHIMNLYTQDGKKTSIENDPIAAHEVIHLISVDSSYFPDALEEGVDSLIISEYLNYFDAYAKQRIITSMLCEIVSPDIVIESYLRKDYSLIEQELFNINPDRVQAYTLKTLLDEYQKVYRPLSDFYNTPLSESEQAKAEIYFAREHSITISVNQILCNYYELKTGKNVADEFKIDDYREECSVSLYKSGEIIDNCDNSYNVLFSMLSIMLTTNTYSPHTHYTYVNTNIFRTNYFNKDTNPNEVLIENRLLIDSKSNKTKVLIKEH